MTKSKNNINKWLCSGQYEVELDKALTNILRHSELSNNEAETASAFELEIYNLISNNTGLAPQIRKEQKVEGIVHTFGKLTQRRSGSGRLDAVVNNIIIEYKHHDKLKRESDIELAYEQVTDYLRAEYLHKGKQYAAILTDGIKIAYFSFVDDEPKHTKLRLLTAEDLDKIVRAIITNNLKKFEPKNITNDFFISPVSYSDTKAVAQILFDELNQKSITEKTLMLFAEWKNLMHLSVDDNGKSRDIDKRRVDLSKIFSKDINSPEKEYKALFALQTTYALLVKLIACKVVDTLNYYPKSTQYSDLSELSSDELQTFFEHMEEGYSYKSMNIRNFLEGDFFSWYADKLQWSYDFYSAVIKLLIKIDNYTSFTIDVEYAPIDIFKDLYMSMIPQSVRHSMGEYFTPEWLTDCVVSKGIELVGKDTWRAIDPCCGSGIFVLTLIKKIVGNRSVLDLDKEKREELIHNILHRVYGIDINPLSVLSARVSYYLALHKLGRIENIEIPIYLGDSAVIPRTIKVDDIDCYQYIISNTRDRDLNVIFPKRWVAAESFGQTMSRMQALVKTDNTDLLCSVITNNLNNEEKASHQLMGHIREFANDLVYLHENHWDGVWVRIVTNFMLIARLGYFDMIIGNPPWVKWEHLPSTYTKRIKEFCDVRHIFCNDGGMFGGAQLNICALISNVTATNWLNKGGILAFLMPDSIMSQNSYEEFRKFYVNYEEGVRLYLQAIDRWLAPLRPFKVGKKSVTQDFNTYYFGSKVQDYRKGISVRQIAKQKDVNDTIINLCHKWEDARRLMAISYIKARQLSSSSTAFTYESNEYDFQSIIGKSDYLYRTGVESTPFEVFKLIAYKPSQRKGHYRFLNDIRKTARYKVKDTPIDGWDFATSYIYPMVQGPAIKPFSFSCSNYYHIIPYKENNTKEPVSLEDLFQDNAELAEYFANHKDLILSQSEKSKSMHRGKAFYSLSKIGEYTFADNIVAARDNSNFCASVIKPVVTPWGETLKPVCVKHTIIISQDENKNFISADEAHYINGVLNSSIVKAYIHSTFKTNGFSLKKAHIFLPKYQPGNKLFSEIMKVSKETSADRSLVAQNTDILSSLYLKLCNELNKHD